VKIESLFRNRPVQQFSLVAREFCGAENPLDLAYGVAKLAIFVSVGQIAKPSF
jgi:hypothetical protein